jgi:hypothetical protein
MLRECGLSTLHSGAILHYEICTIDQKMVALHGTLCANPPRNSNYAIVTVNFINVEENYDECNNRKLKKVLILRYTEIQYLVIY